MNKMINTTPKDLAAWITIAVGAVYVLIRPSYRKFLLGIFVIVVAIVTINHISNNDIDLIFSTIEAYKILVICTLITSLLIFIVSNPSSTKENNKTQRTAYCSNHSTQPRYVASSGRSSKSWGSSGRQREHVFG